MQKGLVGQRKNLAAQSNISSIALQNAEKRRNGGGEGEPGGGGGGGGDDPTLRPAELMGEGGKACRGS